MARFDRLSGSQKRSCRSAATTIALSLVVLGLFAPVPDAARALESRGPSQSSIRQDFDARGDVPLEALRDMQGDNDAKPRGAIAPNGRPFDWAVRPHVNLGNRPKPGWSSIIPTGMIYATDTSPEQTDDARVQIKDLRIYVLSSGSRRWKLVDFSPRPHGGFYREDFSQDVTQSGSIRNEPEGISVQLPMGHNFHFFSGRRSQFARGEIVGVYVRFDARLMGDGVQEPGKSIQYVAAASADYWKDQHSPWAGVGVNNDDVAIGRFKPITNAWNSYSMTTCAADDPPCRLGRPLRFDRSSITP